MNSRTSYRQHLEAKASRIVGHWGLQIWMYHSIADNPNDPHAVHPGVFAAQMEALATARVSVIDLSTALAGLKAWRSVGAVVLTFDDAYKDFLVNAVPVLRRCGFPATVFAPTGLLGGISAWDSYDRSKPLMDWEELNEVQRLGFGIGSHTVSHPRLTQCDSQVVERELRLSLEELRSRLAKVVPVLAYPGGYYGRRETECVRDAGYVGAVGLASRLANYPWTNPYCLRRRRAFN